MAEAAVKDVHWGSEDYRPTSLHGNGASWFARTDLDPAKVTCQLCLTLLAKSESLSWVDRQGDVWRVGDDGLMHTPETAPFPREHVERKWGPLRLVSTTPVTDADSEDHPPCCTACGGKGGTYSGACWDCRGTGHSHPPAAADGSGT